MFLLPEELEYVRPLDRAAGRDGAADAPMQKKRSQGDEVIWRTLRLTGLCFVPLTAATFYFCGTFSPAAFVLLPLTASALWAIAVVKLSWLGGLAWRWVKQRMAKAERPAVAGRLRWRKPSVSAA